MAGPCRAPSSLMCYHPPAFNDKSLYAMGIYNSHHRLIPSKQMSWHLVFCSMNITGGKVFSQLIQHGQMTRKLPFWFVGTRLTLDIGVPAEQTVAIIQQNNSVGLIGEILNKELKDWTRPDISTASNTDAVSCSVLMGTSTQFST
ncbi:hypothetical protein BDZ94DRAFT_160514 [Collybia nuda]|uniref:Uncharacterized protein n=1 Tax=Collybia nuda TaxID=64659 RepID=A0A9P6CEE1_9AGAR|nr:hypothetical protein BDZ94DRAFT_160514 [Collybia nuda]